MFCTVLPILMFSVSYKTSFKVPNCCYESLADIPEDRRTKSLGLNAVPELKKKRKNYTRGFCLHWLLVPRPCAGRTQKFQYFKVEA